MFEKKNAQKLVLELMRKKGNQIKVKKSEQDEKWLLLSEMFEKGMVLLKEENEIYAVFTLNPHQIKLNPFQRVLWHKGEQLIHAKVFRTSPKRVQIVYSTPSGYERVAWVTPDKLSLE